MDIHQEIIAEFDREVAKTRKIFTAIPADADFAYKPHAKSMSLGRLAGHISETCGQWGTGTLVLDKLEFPAGHKFDAYVPADKDALLADFEKGAAESKAALQAFTPEKWDDKWQFAMGGQVWIDESKYRVFRNWVLDHLIHHRAQLGVYLRLLDKPVPGTFGPSADEF